MHFLKFKYKERKCNKIQMILYVMCVMYDDHRNCIDQIKNKI